MNTTETTCCKHCNNQLETSMYYAPCYDDGGSVDSFDVEVYTQPCDCEKAVKEAKEARKLFILNNPDAAYTAEEKAFVDAEYAKWYDGEPGYQTNDELPF